MYRRPHFKELIKRLKEARNFIQVLAGPRQTGKTTLIQQVLKTIDIASHYASADNVPNRSKTWIQQQWEIGAGRGQADFFAIQVKLGEINCHVRE
jgi:hypothetical protein